VEESSIYLNEMWTVIMVNELIGCGKSALTEPLNRTADINRVSSLLDGEGLLNATELLQETKS
jgi:deoxyadenosine/deoxycytidine kinase